MIFNDIDWFSLIHWSFRKIFRQVFRFQKIKCYEVLGSSLLPSSLPSTSYRGVRSSRSWSGLPSGSRFRMRIKNNCSRFLFKLTSELFIPKIFTRFRIRFRHGFRILDFYLFPKLSDNGMVHFLVQLRGDRFFDPEKC